ncbi:MULTISPECIES: maltose acetyltransferase domain-containing protein [unclassified Chryseobacterium]|nr:maltose acetyltransferase domain-containing protein [Chryseobacterium sp. CFS7]MDR4894239.1 maltose acetyltransferase domain-containing protein [Chryseobacterium sp. CFS7]
MTEKGKCAAGLLYNANYDQELIQERIRCKDLCQEYNG